MPFPLPLAVGAAFFLGGLMSLLPAMSSDLHPAWSHLHHLLRCHQPNISSVQTFGTIDYNSQTLPLNLVLELLKVSSVPFQDPEPCRTVLGAQKHYIYRELSDSHHRQAMEVEITSS